MKALIAAAMIALAAAPAAALAQSYQDGRHGGGQYGNGQSYNGGQRYNGGGRGYGRGQGQGYRQGQARGQGYGGQWRQSDASGWRGDRSWQGRNEGAYRGRGASWYRRGGYLPPYYSGYVVQDYGRWHLRQPPRGYYWYRTDDGFVLAAIASGLIFDIVGGGAYDNGYGYGGY